MPSTALKLPYHNVSSDKMSKAQAMVYCEDKRLIGSIYPDTGIYSLIIQTAFKNVAEYIRTNNITCYSEQNAAAVLNYASTLTNSRTVGAATPSDDGRTTSRHVNRATSVTDLPSDAEQTAQGYGRKGKTKGKVK